MKVLGYAVTVIGLGIMAFNGSPRRWEKGTFFKHLIVEIGGTLVALAGLWLLK